MTGVSPTSPGTRTVGPSRSRRIAAEAGYPPADDDLGRRRRQGPAKPREVLAPRRLGDAPGVVAGRSLDRGAGRHGSGPDRRRQPWVMVGRSKGAEPPRLLGARTGSTGRQLAGLRSQRLGRLRPERPVLAGRPPARGGHLGPWPLASPGLRPGRRSEPDTPHRRRHHDPHDRRQPDRRRRDAPDRGHAGHGAHHGRGRHGTATGTDPVAPRLALAGRLRAARDALHRRRPDPAARSTCGSRPRPAPAGGRRRSLRSSASTAGRSARWSPTPHIEVFLLTAAGYRVVLPNIRGSATYGRRLDPAPARRHGRCRCRRRPRRGRPRRRRSGWRTRTDSG